ncbi:MAG: 30S ribosome-binding factor RbfA [Planctomycetes bacterium]|nr:30S ribosome-binding factor RbfA [Planctomycetota bacterium]
MPSRLNLKLAEQIRFRAANILLHEMKDPRIGFLTVTRVELASDLVTCTIYWSVIGTPGDRSKTAHALADAKGFLQRRIAEGLATRSAPQITFAFDESVAGAIKMTDLLKQLRSERGEPAVDAAAPLAEAPDTDADTDADAGADVNADDDPPKPADRRD